MVERVINNCGVEAELHHFARLWLRGATEKGRADGGGADFGGEGCNFSFRYNFCAYWSHHWGLRLKTCLEWRYKFYRCQYMYMVVETMGVGEIASTG